VFETKKNMMDTYYLFQVTIIYDVPPVLCMGAGMWKDKQLRADLHGVGTVLLRNTSAASLQVGPRWLEYPGFQLNERKK
jgi:hypothetical protein